MPLPELEVRNEMQNLNPYFSFCFNFYYIDNNTLVKELLLFMSIQTFLRF